VALPLVARGKHQCALPSVLDQSPIPEGSSGTQALANTLDLARLTDRLGYHRYWVAEHHGGPMLAGPSPEALIGPIAAVTERIRVGSGGVMLPHYSALKVAETFSVLAGLFPGRIDLALGRAAGTDPMTTFALQRDRRQAAQDDFLEQLTELLGYLDDRLPPDHPFARLAKTLPGRPHKPEAWLLGSSLQSAIWAGELGLPYAFADFINPQGAEIAALYRERFAEREHERAQGREREHERARPEAKPRVAVAVWVICADTDEEAQRLAASGRMAFTLLRRGQLIAVPPPEKALRFLEQERERRAQGGGERPAGRRTVVGSPQTVREQLEQVVRDYGAEEAIAVCITYEHDARRRSYELLAEVFEPDDDDDL
jgi:luciferase family oxidoreductase group 1